MSAVPIRVQSSAVNKAAYVGVALHSINNRREYEKTVLANLILDAYRQNPQANPLELATRVNEAQDTYNEQVRRGLGNTRFNEVLGQTEYDAVNSMFNILTEVPGVELSMAIIREAFEWTHRGISASLAPFTQITAQTQLNNSYASAREYERETWEALYDLTATNPLAARVVNSAFGRSFNALTTDTAAEILDRNADFARSEDIREIRSLIGPDGTIVTTLEDLMEQSARQYESVREVLGTDRELLNRISEQQVSLIGFAFDDQRRRATEAEAARQRRAHQIRLEAANSAVFLLSTFIGVHDQRLGNAIQTVGTSAIQIADAVSKYTDEAGELGNIFGATILTGNLVGAAVRIFNLFGGGGASPESLILNEIGEVRNQIRELRREMHDRFDRIDQRLNSIYDNINERFDELDLDIGRLESMIEDVQRSLFEIQSDLNRFERNVFAFLDAGFTQDLRLSITGGLGFRERTGLDLPFGPGSMSFIDLENQFFTWATDFANDPARAGALSRDFSAGAVFDELRNNSLDFNINYVAEFPAQGFGNLPPLAVGRLPNPRVWALATEAYMQLGRESPQHARNINMSRIEQIESEGERLRSAFERITVIEEAGVRRANFELFEALMANYEEKFDTLIGRIREVEEEHKRGMVPDVNLRPFATSIDLFGSAEQPTSFFPTVSPILTCGSTPANPLNAPFNIFSFIPFSYRLAQLLGLGSLDICWSAVATPGRVVTSSEVLRNFAHIGVIIEARFPLTGQDRSQRQTLPLVFARAFIPDNEIEIFTAFPSGSTPPRRVDQVQHVFENWERGENLRDAFTIRAQDSPFFPGLQALQSARTEADRVVREAVENLFRVHQRELYREIVDSFTSNLDVSTAAAELDGAHQMLVSFITLGLPKTLEASDLLRSLLHGERRLMNSELVARQYADALREAESDPSQNVRRLDFFFGSPGLPALESMLQQILEEIDEGQFFESQRLIDTTLGKIRVFRRFIEGLQ